MVPKTIKFYSRISLTLLLNGSFMGCGPKKVFSENPLGDSTQFQEVLQGYQLSDRSCIGGQDGQRPKVATLVYRVWNGSRISTYSFSDSNMESRGSLSGGIVAETVVNVHQVLDCSGPSQNEGCSDDSKTISKPILLPICQESFLYPRSSYEGVAVSSFANLFSIYKYYQSIERQELPKVSLVVLPALERHYTFPGAGDRREFQFDNLSFVDSFLDKPAFVIYPTSSQRQPGEESQSLNLWESSWTLAHEFGHLVLAATSGVQKSALLSSDHQLMVSDSKPEIRDFFSKSQSHFTFYLERFFGFKKFGFYSFETLETLENKKVSSLNSALQGDGRTVSHQDIWSAVNEGYADLFATAASNGNSLTQGVPCIAVSRNSDQGYFQTGEAKSMSSFVLSQFMASDPIPPAGNCSAPGYQSPHTLGAIIAYGLRQLSLSYGQDSATLGKNLVVWARRMGAVVRRGGAFQMQELVFEGVKSFSSQSSDTVVLATSQCQSLYATFPVWFSEWVQARQLYCR